MDAMKHEIIKALRRELCDIKIACVNNHADTERVTAWIRDPKRKAANIAFTEGPERQIAYAVEALLWRSIGGNITESKGPTRF